MADRVVLLGTEPPPHLELYVLWVEAGRPLDLGPFVESLGCVIDGEELVQPDVVVGGGTDND